jgi:hypothetical protein
MNHVDQNEDEIERQEQVSLTRRLRKNEPKIFQTEKKLDN